MMIQSDMRDLNARYFNRQFNLLNLPELLEPTFNYKTFVSILNDAKPTNIFIGSNKEEWKFGLDLQLSQAGINTLNYFKFDLSNYFTRNNNPKASDEIKEAMGNVQKIDSVVMEYINKTTEIKNILEDLSLFER